MEKLSTIQKRENLNEVFVGAKGVGGAAHNYVVIRKIDKLSETEPEDILLNVQFQEGAKNDDLAIDGVLDADLLEIVRDRLTGFQHGEFATKETAQALVHIEEALMWLNRRVEDRIERQVLGTYKK